MRTQNYRLATLQFDEQKNILFYRVKQDLVVDTEEMIEMLTYVQEFMGQVRHYAVVDFGANVTSSTEARQIYADSLYIQTYRISDAFLVKSLPVKLIANFFINVTKPKVNTRMFNDEASAVKWLETLQKFSDKEVQK